MQKIDLYIQLEQCVQVADKNVKMKDIATLYCEDDNILNKARAIEIYRFSEQGPHRRSISILLLIELANRISKEIHVYSLGEPDVLVEYTSAKRPNPVWEKIKVFFVALVSFFGTAFTIMAFHNDIGIEEMLSKVYVQVTGQPSDGFTILEISYSVGLAFGITLFFNHFGKKRLTADPTPIEVEMKVYENDINTTLIESAKRNSESMGVRK